MLKPLKESQTKMEQNQTKMEKRLASIEKQQGLLVEEKARKMAARQFGEDFSRPFIIKSLHDVVKVIANADMPKLPKSDYFARNKAVTKLEDLLKPLLPSFHKAAIEAVNKALQDNAGEFRHVDFDEAKKQFQTDAVRRIETATESELVSLDWEKMYGVTLKLVKDLSENQIDGEGSDSVTLKRRAKILKGRFQRKLKRLKATVENKNLDACNSAGIMLLSALAEAGEDIWKGAVNDRRKWIKDECNVFDFKEEVECDLMPSISVVEKHATITVGEIKTGIAQYKSAKNQMLYTANLLHLALWFVIGGPFNSVVNKGHLYVLDAANDDQRFDGEIDGGISVFVHKSF